jgi:hypothetical protein
MPWVEVFAVFVVCHLVGDYLLQTDRQAEHKPGGLTGDPTARTALLAHVSTYTLAFVPALIWLSEDIGVAELIAMAAVIFITHLVQDDRRLLAAYISKVKGMVPESNPLVALAVDQSFHILTLFAIALWAGT